jgi:hypothetical protein
MTTPMDNAIDLGGLRFDQTLPRDLSRLARRDAPIRKLFSSISSISSMPCAGRRAPLQDSIPPHDLRNLP